jgi:hypothetical protein
MGSEYTYVVPGAEGKKLSIAAQKRLEALRREMPADIDISIDPAVRCNSDHQHHTGIKSFIGAMLVPQAHGCR